MLHASAGARQYAGEPYLRHMVLAAVEAHPDIPIVLHQVQSRRHQVHPQTHRRYPEAMVKRYL